MVVHHETRTKRLCEVLPDSCLQYIILEADWQDNTFQPGVFRQEQPMQEFGKTKAVIVANFIRIRSIEEYDRACVCHDLERLAIILPDFRSHCQHYMVKDYIPPSWHA